MCGICGQFNRDGEQGDADLVRRMTSSLEHRGPDDSGTIVLGPAALGFHRLSIIDLSEGGHQPMPAEDRRWWVVFNGEIYNYRDLRDELEQAGCQFKSSSDTEVLLQAFVTWGTACLQKLQGMFAFAVWDAVEQVLVLARDRIGIKPLYYTVNDRFISFGSEIKALLANSDVEPEVSRRGLLNYFTFGHSAAPDTMYEGILKLRPGHYLVCSRSACTVHQYWDVPLRDLHAKRDERESIEHVKSLLTDAVTSHTIADVPVGAFLSGGVDSSAIVALMAAAGRRIDTFAVGFDVGGKYNELPDARRVARHFGTTHHELTARDVDVERLIQKLVYHYDEPFADAANIPTFLVSQFARQHVKVVMSGEGSDEIFGGYRRYSAERLSKMGQFLPWTLRNATGKLLRAAPSRDLRRAGSGIAVGESAARYAGWLTVFSDDAKASLLSEACAAWQEEYDWRTVYRDHFYRMRDDDIVNRMLYADLKTWLPDTYLEKIDKASMAASLEGRVPFLDHRLVEYAFTLPGSLKVLGLTKKYILKEALRGIVPDSVLIKPKHGFSVPLDEWFRTSVQGFVQDVLLDPSTLARGYFRPEAVRALVASHMTGQSEVGTELWTLLNFELWHRQFID